MTKSITLTLAAFAHDLGAHTRLTRTVSEVWYKQYGKADAATRVALREEFILNFLIGYGMSATKAAKLMALSRPERSTEEQNVYRAAEMKFNYHIVRDAYDAQRAKRAPVSPVDKLVNEFKALTAAQQRSFLAKLRVL